MGTLLTLAEVRGLRAKCPASLPRRSRSFPVERQQAWIISALKHYRIPTLLACLGRHVCAVWCGGLGQSLWSSGLGRRFPFLTRECPPTIRASHCSASRGERTVRVFTVAVEWPFGGFLGLCSCSPWGALWYHGRLGLDEPSESYDAILSTDSTMSSLWDGSTRAGSCLQLCLCLSSISRHGPGQERVHPGAGRSGGVCILV